MIGIAITTTTDEHRKECYQKCIKAIEEFKPLGLVHIYVNVDKEKQGVTLSKNKCIENLYNAGCEHFFLFDDDCWPTKHGWEQVFIYSKLQHTCLIFSDRNGVFDGLKHVKTKDGIDHFNNARGVMMYFTRNCIEKIGGIDLRYSKYGFEHLGLSIRINNRGLTPGQFIMPSGAMKYFYCADMEKTNRPVFCQTDKIIQVNRSRPIYTEEKASKDWKPFRKQDMVLTCLFKNVSDPQGRIFKANYDSVLELAYSAKKHANAETLIFTDNKKPTEYDILKYAYAKVDRKYNLYSYRFIKYLEWMKTNRIYLNNVYLTDATDTGFNIMPVIEKGKVYINTETEGGNQTWLKNKYKTSKYKRTFSEEVLLKRGNDMWNCGVIYGHVDDIILFLEKFVNLINMDGNCIDMVPLNLLCNSEDIAVPVNSYFRQNKHKKASIWHK